MNEQTYEILREKSKASRTVRDYKKYSLVLAPKELKISLKTSCAFFEYSVISYYRIKAELEGAATGKGSWGGRRKSYMTTAQEKRVAEELSEAAEKAGFVDISKIKEKIEQVIGKNVHKTTIYRFLERHGFRKISPRKYHPKQNKEAQGAFKKTSLI